MMLQLDQNTEQRLIQLRNMIESNLANLEDYREYETLLVNTGKFSHADIQSRLQKYGFNNWDDYYKSRQYGIFNDQKQQKKNVC